MPLTTSDILRVVNAVQAGELAKRGEPVIYDTITTFGADAVRSITDDDEIFEVNDPRVAGYVRQFGAQRMRNVTDTIRSSIGKTLAEGLAEGESPAKLRARVRDVFQAARSRLDTIVLTETTRASNYGTMLGIYNAGLTWKEWLATGDAHTRATHAAMDGQEQQVIDKFVSPSGATTDFPGNFGIAAEDINCRCAVLPVFNPPPKATPPPPPMPPPTAPPPVPPENPKPSARPPVSRPSTSKKLGKYAEKVSYDKFALDTSKVYKTKKDVQALLDDVHRQLKEAGFGTMARPPKLAPFEFFNSKPTWVGVARPDLNKVGFSDTTLARLASSVRHERERGIKTVVHEVLHCCSAAKASKHYRGAGIAMEEMLTETNAQLITAKMTGGTPDLVFSSYSGWVRYWNRALGEIPIEARRQATFQMYAATTQLRREQLFKKLTKQTFAPPTNY